MPQQDNKCSNCDRPLRPRPLKNLDVLGVPQTHIPQRKLRSPEAYNRSDCVLRKNAQVVLRFRRADYGRVGAILSSLSGLLGKNLSRKELGRLSRADAPQS